MGHDSRRISGRRQLRILMCALLLLSSSLQWSVVPILPVYASRFHLSGAQQGMLLGATGLATLVISLPAGTLSDRVGAKRLTLGACGLMAASQFAQAWAPAFAVLLGSRFLFGTAYGVLWTAGLTWLAGGAPGQRGNSVLGGSVAISGTGTIAGPAVSGWLVQYLGVSLPFAASGVLLAMITAALGILARSAPSAAARDRTDAAVRALAREPRAVAAVAAILAAGFTSGACSLLVPHVLHSDGASPGSIGLAFSAAAVLFVAASGGTAVVGKRAVRVSGVGLGLLLITVGLAPAVLSTSPAPVVAMLCTTAAARAILWTVGYQLGAVGAQRCGAGVGTMLGLLNGAWAAMAVASPLAAGLGMDHLPPRLLFAVTEGCCAAVLAATVIGTTRLRRTSPSATDRPAGLRTPRRRLRTEV